MLIRPLLALLFAVVLNPRVPIDENFAPQETRTYDVQATAGQYIEIAVESAELAGVRLRGPNNFDALGFLNPAGDAVVVPLLARESGTYTYHWAGFILQGEWR